MFKCGFVSLVGKPNAGKSSLVNALIGEKVSIVSPKAQTTRNNILGIKTTDDYQIVFIDTPGINRANNRLDDYMQKSVKGALQDVNVILLVIDGTKKTSDIDKDIIKKYSTNSPKLVVAITKIDLMDRKAVFDKIADLSSMGAQEIVPISSLKDNNLDELIKVLVQYLPETDPQDKYFDDDMYTDKSLKFIVGEIIREKALYLLDNEIPHGLAVDIKVYEDLDSIVNIEADIICEKDSHKSIIIGAQGAMLKKIGHNARVSIQKLVQKKVDLKLWVRVNKKWRENEGFLMDIGYNNKDI